MLRLLGAGGVGLVAASAVVLAALALRPEDDPRSMLRVSHLAVALHAATALLALWAAAGRSSRWRRALGLFGGSLAVLAWFSAFGEWPDYWYLLVAAAAQLSAVLISVPLLRGIRAIQGEGACPESPGPAGPRSRSRSNGLSLRDLMLSVAAAAALLTPLSTLGPFVHHRGQVPSQVAHGLALGSVSLATAWVACRRAIGPSALLGLALCLMLGVASEAFVYGRIFPRVGYRPFLVGLSYNLVMHCALLFIPLRLVALLGPTPLRGEDRPSIAPGPASR